MKTDSMGTMVDVLTRISKSKDGVKNALGIGGKEWFDEILRAKEALPELVRLRSLLKGGGDEGSLQKALEYRSRRDRDEAQAGMSVDLGCWRAIREAGVYPGSIPSPTNGYRPQSAWSAPQSGRASSPRPARAS